MGRVGAVQVADLDVDLALKIELRERHDAVGAIQLKKNASVISEALLAIHKHPVLSARRIVLGCWIERNLTMGGAGRQDCECPETDGKGSFHRQISVRTQSDR
jgi:hypothetical protein